MTPQQTYNALLSAIAIAIPLVSLAALIAGTVVFVRYKGTMDALKEAASTFERLAEAYRMEAEELRRQIPELEARIEELELFVEHQRQMLTTAIEHAVTTVTRIGVCSKRDTCKDWTPPKPGIGSGL